MSLTYDFEALKDSLKASERMPAVFIGHGNPMLALNPNHYTQRWSKLGEALPRPQAVLVISAHWMSQGSTLVDISIHPRTIHDFYGFPERLYRESYPAPGAPDLAKQVQAMLVDHHAETDETWGLDHGSWTVLKYLFPQADVPVFQLSIDMSRDFRWHLELGQQLAQLRERGVLILGSGNVVHNLRDMRPGQKPLEFAVEFDELVEKHVGDRNFKALTDVASLGNTLKAAHPSVDHLVPLFPILGAASDKDDLSHLVGGEIDMGSVSMRSFLFH